ncbi:MAG: molybdenum cofactor biosynthesis protein MoaE, partial [bacterium]
MRVGVRLFARYREAAGRERLEVDLPEGSTVEAAWSAVVDRHPQLSPYRPFTLFAVGNEYVEPEYHLMPSDELCLFPPVSGGGGGDVYRVVDEPLSPDAIAADVDDPGAGGIVIFSGVVRNETGGRSVKSLEYDAHAPMAEAKMREIGEAVHARWAGVKRVAILHRIGRLEIGESS